jgi:glycosyltransferase involved in cell wall biosynthesis
MGGPAAWAGVPLSARHKNIIYVALGPHRIRAAQQHTARLAADGAQVQLVVADGPEWTGARSHPGVTVHRAGEVAPDNALDEARRFVLGRGGPLLDADLLIAGDLQAVPVAWAAMRRRPSLAIQFEPCDDPARRPAPADLAVVTPWYPSENDPFNGSFVKAAVDAVNEHFERVTILHTQAWSYPHGSPVSSDRIGLMAERLAARSGNAVVEDCPEGELTRVVVPILSARRDYATWANAHVEMLREGLPTGRIEAPLVHAHTGIYGGVAATRLARSDARIVVTEHSSFLPAVFRDPASRRMYDEMLQRVDLLLCVSQHIYNAVSGRFPHRTNKLRIVPNVIDFGEFAVRPSPPRDLLRWLYVGRMTEHKGVLTLLDAFGRIATDEPRATLTLVGSGETEDAIRLRIREMGMGERVELHPAVPPKDVVGLMHRHDLLVHASRGETFGMTVVEAVATGTPVLVARSPGPEETLAGLDRVAGLLFDGSDDPDVIVEGYRELRKHLGELDLATARASMLARYGSETVALQLLDAYRPMRAAAREPDPTRPEAGRVVLIAIGPPNFRRTRRFAHDLLGRGFAVDLVTIDPAVWSRVGLDECMRVHALGAAEDRHPLLRVERLLVFRAPGKVLDVALRLARRRHALWPELVVRRTQHFHGVVAEAFHAKAFQRGYQILRPRILWRIAQREVVPNLDMSRTERVVVSGSSGVTIGWHLARRYPGLTVTISMSSVDD